MAMVTIDIPQELHERLRLAAMSNGRSLEQHIERLLDDEARRQRFDAVRRAMATTPPDADYFESAADWQADRWL